MKKVFNKTGLGQPSLRVVEVVSTSTKHRGFTLLELLVVIAIIGIISTVGCYYLSNAFSSIKLQAAAQEIASDLRLCQQKAISEKTDVLITFNTNNYQFLSINKTLPKPLTVQNPQLIKFSQTGNPTPGYFGTIMLIDGHKTKKIVISPIGRIRIE